MKCNKCANLTTKTTPYPGMFLLWGCTKSKLEWMNTTDFRAKKNWPSGCKDYQLQG